MKCIPTALLSSAEILPASYAYEASPVAAIAIIGGSVTAPSKRLPNPDSISASTSIGTFECFCISFKIIKEVPASPNQI